MIKSAVLNKIQPSYRYVLGSAISCGESRKLIDVPAFYPQQEYPEHIPDRGNSRIYAHALRRQDIYAQEQLLEMVRHIPLKCDHGKRSSLL